MEIFIRELKETEPNTNSIATFAMDDQPINMELSYTTINNVCVLFCINLLSSI